MNETIIRFQAGQSILTCRIQHCARRLPRPWLHGSQVDAIGRCEDEGRTYLGIMDTATIFNIPSPEVRFGGAARWEWRPL